MRFVDHAHQTESEQTPTPAQIVPTGAAHSDDLVLPHDPELQMAVIHYLAPSIQALRRKALAQKPRPITSSPILACRSLISSSWFRPDGPFLRWNTSFSPFNALCFNSVIMCGWLSCRAANSAIVSSLRVAAIATFALKSGEQFRRSASVASTSHYAAFTL